MVHRHRFKRFAITLLVALYVTAPGLASAQLLETAIIGEKDIIHPVFATKGMVATQEERATRIGLDILKQVPFFFKISLITHNIFSLLIHVRISMFKFFFWLFRAAPMAYGSSWGSKLELRLLTSTTATTMWDPSCICNLHHSSCNAKSLTY